MSTHLRSRFADASLVGGCWSWGDRRTWGFGTRFGEPEIREVVDVLAKAETAYFDTAEVYAHGASEEMLARLVPHAAPISDKFFPYAWRQTYRQFRSALQASLRRLGRDAIDAYSIHHPTWDRSLDRWSDHLVAARQEGLIREIGTSNLSADVLERVLDRLATHGERVTVHQARYNLCDRRVETNGVQAVCRDAGIVLLAHSALGQGLLGGTYGPGRPAPGRRGSRWSEAMLMQTQPVRDLLQRYASRLGTSVAGIALAWLKSHGATPLVGLHDARQAREAVAGCALVLPDEMLRELDDVTVPWQHRR